MKGPFVLIGGREGSGVSHVFEQEFIAFIRFGIWVSFREAFPSEAFFMMASALDQSMLLLSALRFLFGFSDDSKFSAVWGISMRWILFAGSLQRK